MIYRHFLSIQLTTHELVVRTSVLRRLGWEILRVPLTQLREVKQCRFLVLFGIKVTYRDDHGATRTMKWYTFRYTRWTKAFQELGIAVQPYRDWLYKFAMVLVHSLHRQNTGMRLRTAALAHRRHRAHLRHTLAVPLHR